eukprot:TRINITY_DN3341_c0_g2_i3.p1 TRINITY_DN3341_c0_g2~~TRINITY_DN3341_c0_g2_i3.p1  ORF type:complete len:543 (+),score=73.82 TRINITY_DN3341_c0_g2_i3:851-2479(+)
MNSNNLSGSKFLETVAEMLEYNLKTWDRIQDKIDTHVCGSDKEKTADDNNNNNKTIAKGPRLRTAERERITPADPVVASPPPTPQKKKPTRRNNNNNTLHARSQRRHQKQRERLCMDNGKVMTTTTVDVSAGTRPERHFLESRVHWAVDVLTVLPASPYIQQYLFTEKRGANFFLIHKESVSFPTLSKGATFKPSSLKTLLRNLLQGLNFLESHNTAHGYIRSTSIFYDRNTKNMKLTCPIVQWAVKREWLAKERPWLPPEEFSKDVHNDIHPQISTDIWALGCLTMELYTGERPWSHLGSRESAAKMLSEGYPVQLPVGISGDLAEFLKNCFVRDPKKRPAPEQLLQHPYLAVDGDDDGKSTHFSPVAPSPLESSRRFSAGSGLINRVEPPQPLNSNLVLSPSETIESPVIVKSEAASVGTRTFSPGQVSYKSVGLSPLTRQASVKSIQQPAQQSVSSPLEQRLQSFESSILKISERQEATNSVIVSLLQQNQQVLQMQQQQQQQQCGLGTGGGMPYHFFPPPPPHPQDEMLGAAPITISR